MFLEPITFNHSVFQSILPGPNSPGEATVKQAPVSNPAPVR
ncbi:hypothetical protein [uncultured Gimesia sp.]